MGTSSGFTPYHPVVKSAATSLGLVLAVFGVSVLFGQWEPHSAQVRANIIGIVAILVAVPLIRYGWGRMSLP